MRVLRKTRPKLDPKHVQAALEGSLDAVTLTLRVQEIEQICAEANPVQLRFLCNVADQLATLYGMIWKRRTGKARKPRIGAP